MPKKKTRLDRFTDLTWNDIEEWAGGKMVSRGKNYQREGRVSDLAITDDGGLIARVAGSHCYATKVIMEGDGLPDSLCSCPYEFDCKHAVAVVIEYMKRLENDQRVPKAKLDDDRMELLEDEEWDEESIDKRGSSLPLILAKYQQESTADLTPPTNNFLQRKEKKMGKYTREELEEMKRRWLAVNEAAEDANDWSILAEYYTDDAVYTWHIGHDQKFIAEGRKQIAEWALGFEMLDFDDWKYPYEQFLIDAEEGEAVGFWRQVTPFKRDDGSFFQTASVGLSRFKYAGDYKWSWQQDIFDVGDITGLMVELGKADKLTQKLKDRMAAYAKGEAPGTVKT